MSETLYYVVHQLNLVRPEWKRVEDESGVSRKTFEKIAYGYTRNPRVDTVERLAAYFRAKNSNGEGAQDAAA